MFRVFFIALTFWLTACFAHARQSVPIDTGVTELTLISDHDTVTPGQSFTVALRMEFEGNWYTYWRNAGDSGEAVSIVWDLPEGVSAGPIQWPVPKVKTVGPIVSYAMSGDVWLPVEITLDESVDPELPITLQAKVYFLVCDDVCIPETGALSLPMGVGVLRINGRDMARVESAKSKIPALASARGSAAIDGGKVVFNIANLPKGFDAAALFPNENPIIIHSDPVTLSTAEKGLSYRATPGYGWEAGTPDGFEATLVAKDGRAALVRIATDEVVDLGAVIAGGTGVKTSLWGAALGAFLGGLILNLMPCVFPIISLKALSLAKTAHGERSAVRHAAWAYTAGVLVSLVLFALIIVALKAGGASIGWGFQLQSPWFVAVLSLLLFAVGLNLFGVFELGGRFQNIGASGIKDSSPRSSFLTGVLATLVATPCSGPFMAVAIGYALAGSALVTLIVFMALGIGFALPFLLVAYVPGLLSRLPKPGAWMETFKQFLAFPMFAAAIYFAWVLTQQAGADGVLKLLSGALALMFSIWLLRKAGPAAKILGVVMLVIAIGLPISASSDGEVKVNTWSAAAVATSRAENRPVFVDFTAAWCVTCKVNEMTVLNRKRTLQLFDQTDTKFLVADWTNKDDVIAAELQRFGRAGVPLYLVYRPGAEAAEVLPQVLTYEILKEALE